MGDFSDKVFDVVCQIPTGCVASYGQVARMIGSPRSARYVGYALRNNPSPAALAKAGEGGIPCHRVVFKDGSLCKGFIFGGPEVQKKMLLDEGVTFIDDDHIDMNACQWKGDAECTGKEDRDYPTQPPPDFDWEAELGW